jgi:Bacterial conjugation TrbI-like protein
MDQNHDRSSDSKLKPSLGSMAKMLDLENAYSSADSNFGSDRSATLSSFNSDEIGSEDAYTVPPVLQDDPYESRTKQPLWANPFAKAGLVGTGTLVAVIATSTLLGDITKGTNVQAEPEKKEVVSTAEVPASKEQDKGKLLAQIALGTQGRDLEELNKDNHPTRPPTPNPKNPPVSIRTGNTANRSVSKKDLAALAAILRQRSQPAPVQAAAFNQNLDPQQQWQMLSQVGSYGQISSGNSGVNNGGGNFANSNSQNAQLVSQVQTSSAPEEESPLLTGRVRRSVVTGSTAQGLLSTPVVWEGGRRGAQGDADNAGAVDDEDRFIIQLTSALKASDGSEALAIGTPLVVKVRTVSGSGTLKLSAVAVIMDGEETQIPPGSISIRASGGGPLTARNMQDRGGEIASSDAGIFALAGISKAASLFTRAQSTTTSNGFNSVTSTQNPAPDILAGILEGGTGAIINQIQARNERAIQESLARPDLWMLAAGTSVQVFVNKSVPNL